MKETDKIEIIKLAKELKRLEENDIETYEIIINLIKKLRQIS